MGKKEVVVIGGGTGLSSLLKGIKNIDNIELSAIVTVADDGGSTGVIRKEFNIPAVGDLRKVILSLTSTENESLVEKIMDYRFQKNNTFLDNHSLGNIILTALIKIENDFYLGIEKTKELFNLKGEVIPLSNENDITLKAYYTDNSVGIGESSIPNFNKKIDYIEYTNSDIKVNELAIKKLSEADYIIFSMGSLYTSLIANLIIPSVKNAIINNNKAEVIYLANVMTQNGETHDMSIYDHVHAIEKHLGKQIIKKVIISNDKIDEHILNRYAHEKSFKAEITNDLFNKHFEVISENLLCDNINLIRHDMKKLHYVFKNILK